MMIKCAIKVSKTPILIIFSHQILNKMNNQKHLFPIKNRHFSCAFKYPSNFGRYKL